MCQEGSVILMKWVDKHKGKMTEMQRCDSNVQNIGHTYLLEGFGTHSRMRRSMCVSQKLTLVR